MKNWLIVFITLYFFGCNSKHNLYVYWDENLKKNGFVNEKGEIQIKCEFDNAYDFNDGVAWVKLGGKYGLINTDGEFVIKPKYNSITNFKDNIAIVVESDTINPYVIDKNGKVIYTIDDASQINLLNKGYLRITIGNSINNLKNNDRDKSIYKDSILVINQNGIHLKIGGYNNILEVISDNEFVVKNYNNKSGVVDKSSKILIPFEYDYITKSKFKDLYIVSLNGQFGVINSEGKYVINPIYEIIIDDKSGFVARRNYKYGYIDDKGNTEINFEYNQIVPFLDSDLTPILVNDRWGFINKENKIVINPIYTNVYGFVNGFAKVKKENSNYYCIINEKGDYVSQTKHISRNNQADDYIFTNLVNNLQYNNAINEAFNWLPDPHLDLTDQLNLNSDFKIENLNNDLRCLYHNDYDYMFESFIKEYHITGCRIKVYVDFKLPHDDFTPSLIYSNVPYTCYEKMLRVEINFDNQYYYNKYKIDNDNNEFILSLLGENYHGTGEHSLLCHRYYEDSYEHGSIFKEWNSQTSITNIYVINLFANRGIN